MAKLRITAFGGIIPKLAERLLPENAAQEAFNCKVASGELRPMRKAKKRYAPTAASAVASIFKVDASTWFVWPTADINMVQCNFETEARFAYTGDGIPKITTKTLGTPVAASGVPASARTLGIAAPQVAPTLAVVGGTVPVVTRFYGYTFVSDWGEESSLSPISALTTGNENGTWQLTGMDAAPPNTGSVSAATHSGGEVTVTTTARHYLRAGDPITIGGVVGMTDLNASHTVKSVVSTTQFKVALTTAQTYTSGGTWTRVAPWGTCTKRIYRTAGSAGSFQLVADQVSGTTYNDTLGDALILGDSLISDGWVPPPAGLKGLVSLPNGAICGFLDSTVYVSEPFQPHAFPAAYQRKSRYPIVGIATTVDGSIVVATEGAPGFMTGVEPSDMILQQMDEPMPCLSRRSVCSIGDSVVYATRGGLARLGPAGFSMLTAELFSDEDWYALSPSTMRCAYARGSLYVVSDATPKTMFILGLTGNSAVVSVPVTMDTIHVDAKTGHLFYAFLKKVYEFDPDEGVPLVQNWWSKEFVIPNPVNMGAAKVVFSEAYTDQALAAFETERLELIAENNALIAAAATNGAINKGFINEGGINDSSIIPPSSEELVLTFLLYANGKLKFSRAVKDSRPFKLPAGYKSDTFSVRVMANTHIRSIEIAETATALREV